jgi:hypothetical protein
MGGDKAATLQHKCVWATTCNKVRQWGRSVMLKTVELLSDEKA